MRRTEDITYNVTGQSLAFRVLSGRPTAGTFKVFEDTIGDDAETTDTEFSGSCTVDSFSTTVDAASGPAQSNPRKLFIASTVSMVRLRKYWLEEDGAGEWIEPVIIKSNDYAICRYPLRRDYTTAATLKSTYLFAAIDATWVADEDHLSNLLDPAPDYRCRIEYTAADASTEVGYVFFDLVRTPIDHAVVMTDLAARWPGLMRQIDNSHDPDQGQSIVDSAWRALRAKFAAVGINDAAIRDFEGLDEAVLLMLRLVLAGGGVHPQNFDAVTFYELAKTEFDDFWGEHYRTVLKRATASSSDGGVDPDVREVPFWRK